jgi:hypothetical protein
MRRDTCSGRIGLAHLRFLKACDGKLSRIDRFSETPERAYGKHRSNRAWTKHNPDLFQRRVAGIPARACADASATKIRTDDDNLMVHWPEKLCFAKQ